MKTVLDYGDLEQVAKRVYDLLYEHAEEVRLEPGWNRARIITEAVTSVAFPE